MSIKRMRKKHIGRFVLYKPTGEIGVVKGFNNKKQIASVVYKCGGNWSEYDNYTSQCTNYTDIKYLKL